MSDETHGYPCGCVYYTTNLGYVFKAVFCEKHRVMKEVLIEGLA